MTFQMESRFSFLSPPLLVTTSGRAVGAAHQWATCLSLGRAAPSLERADLMGEELNMYLLVLSAEQ